MTVFKTKRWTGIQGVLLGGLTFLALMYLPGVGLLVGVLIFVYDYFRLGREPMPAVSAVPEKA